MISVKELQIGDLVNYRPGWINEETNQVEYESGTGFPVRIEMLYYSHGEGLVQYNDGENDGIEAAEYELFPIPLTDEILKKNKMREFEHRNPGQGDNLIKKWWHNDGSYYVSLYWVGDECTYTVGDSVTRICRIKYVHQLQHALRLCGIEKEIIL